jgi:hypothetical protein
MATQLLVPTTRKFQLSTKCFRIRLRGIARPEQTGFYVGDDFFLPKDVVVVQECFRIFTLGADCAIKDETQIQDGRECLVISRLYKKSIFVPLDLVSSVVRTDLAVFT